MNKNQAKYLSDLEITRKKLKKYFDKWFERLLLHSWYIDIHWEYEPNRQESRMRGQMPVQWEYLRADFYIYLPLLWGMREVELEEFIVHELMHIMVNEMRDDSPDNCDHEERVVTSLARAFMNTRKG